MEILKNREALSNAPIGVFDSGVGGLTVAREIMRQIPNEKIVYFGLFPYNFRSKMIPQHTKEEAYGRPEENQDRVSWNLLQ